MKLFKKKRKKREDHNNFTKIKSLKTEKSKSLKPRTYIILEKQKCKN